MSHRGGAHQGCREFRQHLTPDRRSFLFTTQVHIVPDVLPHSFEEFRKTLK
jgi:hypothetical protein